MSAPGESSGRAGKISDTDLALRLGLTPNDLRTEIRKAIFDGSIRPEDYLAIRCERDGDCYFLSARAMLILASRVDTPEAMAALTFVTDTVMNRHPTLLRDLLGPGAVRTAPKRDA